MSASQRWHVADAEFPVNGTSRQRLGFAVKYASLAPTQTDWQPWDIEVDDAHMDLCVNAEEDSELDDGALREVMLRCGMALQYLKVALRHFGCLGRIDLFPDLDRRSLLARMHFGTGSERDPHEKSLFEAITASRDHHAGAADRPVTESTLGMLCQAVSKDRSWMELTQSEASRQRVLEFTLANEPSRRFSTPAHAFGLVKTKTDDELGWLAAGQTVALAVLHAQALGLPWECLNQVPEREAREALRREIGHKGFAQAVLCFGTLVHSETVRMAPSVTTTATFS